MLRVSSSAEDEAFSAIAEVLQATGEFRVLRRLLPRAVYDAYDGGPRRQALVVDVETTGLDAENDEIIELSMVPFAYGLDGRIFEVGQPFSSLRQPEGDITPKIQALTGITNEMVVGKSIDPAAVSGMVSATDLIIAHNAAFDRGFLEKFCDSFAAKPWACSMSGIDWAGEGYEGTKLTYLAMQMGFFFDGHRAEDDCRATIELLANSLARTGERAMRQLLDGARKSSWRIWATNASFEQRHVLKSRGYRWNMNPAAGPRAWYIDIRERDVEDEVQFLRASICRSGEMPLIRELTALERFSVRLS